MAKGNSRQKNQPPRAASSTGRSKATPDITEDIVAVFRESTSLQRELRPKKIQPPSRPPPDLPYDIVYRIVEHVQLSDASGPQRRWDLNPAPRRYGYKPEVLRTLTTLCLTSRTHHWHEIATAKLYANIEVHSAKAARALLWTLQQSEGEKLALTRRFMLAVAWKDCKFAGIERWMLEVLFIWLADHNACHCIAVQPDIFEDKTIHALFQRLPEAIEEIIIVDTTYEPGQPQMPTPTVLPLMLWKGRSSLERLALPATHMNSEFFAALATLPNLKYLCLPMPHRRDMEQYENLAGWFRLLGSTEFAHIRHFSLMRPQFVYQKEPPSELDAPIASAQRRGVVVTWPYAMPVLKKFDADLWGI